jgi:hypothetical protein
MRVRHTTTDALKTKTSHTPTYIYWKMGHTWKNIPRDLNIWTSHKSIIGHLSFHWNDGSFLCMYNMGPIVINHYEVCKRKLCTCFHKQNFEVLIYFE